MSKVPKTPVSIIVRNLVGEDIGIWRFAGTPSVDELRKKTAERVPGVRFQLLQGSSILKGDDVVCTGPAGQPVQLTLVVLPSAGTDASLRARPVVLEEPIDEQMSIMVQDVESGEDALLPLRYFVAADGKAHLGVLASEAARMVGADPLAFAALATVAAVSGLIFRNLN